MVDIKDLLKDFKDRGLSLVNTVQNDFSVFQVKDDKTMILIKVSVDGFTHKNNENSIVSTGLVVITVPSKDIMNTPKITPNEDLEVEEIIRGGCIIKNEHMNTQLVPTITQVKRPGSRLKNGNPIYQVSANVKQINLGLNTDSKLPKPDIPGIQ